MFRYVLKGAAIDAAQLAHRAKSLAEAGLPVALELHTFGARDLNDSAGRKTCLDNIAALREQYHSLDLTLHVPLQDVATVTSQNFDEAQVGDAIAFASEIRARQVVVHRYWGLVYGQGSQRADRETATAAFNDTISRLAATNPDITLLVENVGHYSLLPRDGKSFLAGPLDHFFPWEIQAFREFLARDNLTNVAPFVDVAHATLSANLFNWRRAHYSLTDGDARYSAILDSDLDRTDRLHPFDFADNQMTWLHLSDSVFYPAPAREHGDIPLDALVSEGLEIGTGNLPWKILASKLAGASEKIGLVFEVEPAAGETHRRNEAQMRSLNFLRELLEH
jgi:hypothetical protein